jgi:hypothetical protein
LLIIIILLIASLLNIHEGGTTTRWIVEVKSNEIQCLDSWYAKMGLDKKGYLKKRLPIENWFVIEIPQSFENSLASLSCIQTISLDHLLRKNDNIPNDQYFPSQSDMYLIGVTAAWDISTGGLIQKGDTIVVAIIDDGSEINHEDLVNNIWHNNAEIPNDGIDNDNNGYVDYYGINITKGNDNHAATHHGTSVCGIIGAIGNNERGVCGINRNIKIMTISYDFHISELVEAYQYVVDMRKKYNDSNGNEGAFVVAVNLSAGIDYQFEENYPIWCSMYDKLGIEGVLSVCSVPNNNHSVDEDGGLPALCSSPFTIIVTNVTPEDKLQEKAAYGRVNVDIGAPGELSLTTDTSNSYNYFNGTSAAVPHVTGAVALLYSLSCDELFTFNNRNADIAIKIKNAILASGTPNQSLYGKTLSGNRLQVDAAAQQLLNECQHEYKSKIDIRFISPNPVLANIIKFYFEVLGDASDIYFEMYNINGGLTQSSRINLEDIYKGYISVNASSLPAGLYLIVFGNKNQKEFAKVVVN